MSELLEHAVKLYHLPFPEELELFRIEELVIGYQNSWSLDIGALCYLHRSGLKRKPGNGRKVDHSSFSAARAEKLRDFARTASTFFSASGFRISTIFSFHSNLVRFLDWCDNHEHSAALSCINSARNAFKEYANHLRELVDKNELHVNTAADYQQNVIDVMDSHFGFENLGQGVRMLAKSKQLGQPTPVPQEEAQAQVLAWCTCLFWGLSELVLEMRKFPFALSIPSYLNWPDDRIWVFPLRRWCETPVNLNSSQKYMAYNYQHGELRNQEQIVALFGRTRFPISKLIARADDRLAAANLDPLDYSRCGRAALAMQSFFRLY